jgi:hypothetical protein
MGISGGPQIIRDTSLVLALEASDQNSNNRYQGRVWTDLSGNNNSGSIINGPSLDSDSYGSFNFNGINSYITLARTVQDDFTLSCWFRTSQSLGNVGDPWYNGAGLIDAEVGGYQSDFGLSVVGRRVTFGTGNPPNFDVWIYSPLSYSDNLWHQATATRIKSTGTINLYIDGAFITTGTSSSSSLSTSPTLRIGSIQSSATTGFFSGSISTVQIYNKALSAAEVQQNYNQYKTRFNRTTPNIITYTSLNTTTAIESFNDVLEFSNVLVGSTSFGAANAVALVNETP